MWDSKLCISRHSNQDSVINDRCVTQNRKESLDIYLLCLWSVNFFFFKHQDARAIHEERIVLSKNVTGDWFSAPVEEVCLTASPSAVVFSSRIPLWEFWQDSESPYLLEPTSLSSPRVLFLLKPPSLESSFHQNFLPFSLLLPKFSQRPTPKSPSSELSPYTPSLPESPSTQGPLFPPTPAYSPQNLLSSESTTPASPSFRSSLSAIHFSQNWPPRAHFHKIFILGLLWWLSLLAPHAGGPVFHPWSANYILPATTKEDACHNSCTRKSKDPM